MIFLLLHVLEYVQILKNCMILNTNIYIKKDLKDMHIFMDNKKHEVATS